MSRFIDWVLRHRAIVLGGWLLLAVAGAVTAPTTVERLTFDFNLPGEPSTRADELIAAAVETGSVNPPLLVVANGPAAVTVAEAGARVAEQVLPGAHVVGAASEPTLVSSDGRVAVSLVYPSAVPGPDPYAAARPILSGALSQAQTPPGTTVASTDFLSLAEGEAGDDRGLLVEVLIGATGALVILVLVFGSLLAAAPLVSAAVSILGTFLALLGLTYLGDISFIVQFLIALIGLGVAIDYSLLIVMRWREELTLGRSNEDAVRRAVDTAGRAVLTSGLTVAISLAALVLTPAPFLRSVGVGGLLIPAFSVATALTLLPALLSLVGPRLLWPKHSPTSPRSRLWATIGRLTVRHRWAAVVVSAGVLLVMASPVSGLLLGSPQVRAIAGDPPSSPSETAAHTVLDSDLPIGVFRPLDVAVEASQVGAVLPRVARVSGVAGTLTPTGDWAGPDVARVIVIGSDDPATAAAGRLVDSVRAVVGTDRVTGSAAQDRDFIHSTYVRGSWVLALVVLATFLLLARALRSFWLPVKALLLNAISLAAAFGLTVLIWQRGVGVELLFGTPASGSITTWVPVAAFAFLFGLSMDYEVFILARMREAWDTHGDNGQAVVEGLAYTGRLVTSAAAILVFAFVALATVPTVEVKILATTLALGIALDAVIVRGLLAPGLVAVLGRRNWTMPRWLATITRVPQPARSAARLNDSRQSAAS